MVFQHRFFIGKTLARVYFAYHFLPVFIWLLSASVKIILHFAFDLIEDALNSTSSSSAQHAPALLFKFQVLLLLCLGVLITHSVFVRFAMDSLPGTGHPKMRKNFGFFIKQLQAAQRAAGLSARAADRMFASAIIGTAGGILCLLFYLHVRFDCGLCSFFSHGGIDVDDSLATASSAEIALAGLRLFADVAPMASHVPGTFALEASMNGPVCPAEQCGAGSHQEFRCEVVFKTLLVWWLVVWQWGIVMLSTYTRPCAFKSPTTHTAHPQERIIEGPRGANDHPASITKRTVEDGFTVDRVVHHARVFSQLEDVLLDDRNWDHVVGDASYSGLLMSVVYLIFGSFNSDRGIMYGISTTVVVASGQVCFYAGVWFMLHWFSTVHDSVSFLATWVLHYSPSDRFDRRWVPAIIGVYLLVVAALVKRLYGNYLVFILCVYCVMTIVPVITFVLNKNKYRKFVRRFVLHPLGYPRRPYRRGSRRASAPSPFFKRRRGRRQPHRVAITSGESSDSDSDYFTEQTRTSDSRLRLRAAAAAEASSGSAEDSSDEQITTPGQTPSILTKLSEKLPSSASFASLRYKIYGFQAAIMSLFLVIVLVAVVQRVGWAPGEVADTYFVAHPPGYEGKALSVTMTMRNLSFTSGHVLIHGPSAPSEAEVQMAQQHNYCSHRVQGVTLAEYTLLSQLAYLPKGSHDFEVFTRDLLGRFELRNSSLHSAWSKLSRVVYYEMYDRELDLSVISVRGTTAFEFTDWLVDMDIWFESFVFQQAARFLPGLGLWPLSTRSQVIQVMSVVLEAVLPSTQDAAVRHYFVPIAEHVLHLRKHFPKRKIALVGHSLGGGIAKIVGGQLDVPVVALAAPGIGDEVGKYGIMPDQLRKNVINIHPNYDWVSRVGSTVGTVVQVECSEGRPDSCHCPMAAACELLNVCGHPQLDVECRFQRHTTVQQSLYHTVFKR